VFVGAFCKSGMSAGERRRLAGASVACALLLVCLAAGAHFRGKARRNELAARFDRWGIPIDEAVDNHPTRGQRRDDRAREARARASGRIDNDKVMLQTVEALEGKMDTLAAQVSRLGSTVSSSAKKPVQKEVVRVVHDHGRNNAELSALKTIQTDIENLITVDATKEQRASEHSEHGEADREQREEERQNARAKRKEERKERRAQELKDVEKRTMEAVKDAMARQRALDMQEAAAETERRRAARRQLEQHAGRAQSGRSVQLDIDDKIPLCTEDHPENCKGSRASSEEQQPQAKSRWGRRDGETFDTYLGRSTSDDGSRALGRSGDDDGAENRGIRSPELATAVTASRSALQSTAGSVRDRVLQLEKREEYLEQEERQSLDELPAISADESRAESAVASDMQSLQIAKDRRVLAQRAVQDDTYNTGPLQTREDRRTLITATKTEDDVRSKLRDDLHALAQAKLDAKRGPILAQSLHKVRSDLDVAKDKLKVWDQVQEAKALEQSKDFAARR